MKRVRITLEVDAHFVRLLNANLQLNGTLSGDREPDVLHILGIVALGEARGAPTEQVHIMTPPQWRPHIEAVHEERRWQKEGEAEWHTTK